MTSNLLNRATPLITAKGRSDRGEPSNTPTTSNSSDDLTKDQYRFGEIVFDLSQFALAYGMSLPASARNDSREEARLILSWAVDFQKSADYRPDDPDWDYLDAVEEFFNAQISQ